MGLCGSMAQDLLDAVAEDPNATRTEIKLLLLGLAGAGKSTIFKQLSMMYTDGISKEERYKMLKFLRKNLAESVLELYTYGLKAGVCKPVLSEEEMAVLASKEELSDENVKALTACSEVLLKLRDECPTFLNVIKKLDDKRSEQESETRLEIYGQREHMEFFWQNLALIFAVGHEVSDEELLKIRRSTVGHQNLKFRYKKDGYDVDINLIDVGGQLHERKFWVEHCESATGLIYVSALSDFNRVGEGGMNRFLESFEVLSCLLTDHRQLAKLPVVVMLNKTDIFKKMVVKDAAQGKHSLSRSLPRFPQELERDAKKAMDWIQKRVEGVQQHSSKSRMRRKRHKKWIKGHESELTSFLSCATDKKIMSKLFDKVIEIVLAQNLKASGFDISIHDLNLYTFDERTEDQMREEENQTMGNKW